MVGDGNSRGPRSKSFFDNGKETEEKLPFEGRDHTILQPPRSVEWSSMASLILTLPNQPLWQLFVTFSTIIVYIVGILCFFMAPQELKYFLIIYGICDTIYLLDVTILLLHRFWKGLNEKFQVKQRHFMYFIIDIVSLLSQEFIVWAIAGVQNRYIYFCRFPSFLRLYRVLLLANETLSSVQKYRLRWLIAHFFVIFVLILHLLVCIWYALGCGRSHCDGEYWTNILNTTNFATNTTYDWYKICYYVAITLASNTGYGDFYGTNIKETVYCMCVMVIGFVFIRLFLVSMVTVQVVNNRKRGAKFICEMHNINRFLLQIKASKELTQRMIGYYKILWTNKNGVKTAPAFYTLPNALQMELTYDINIAHFQNSLLFKNQPEPFLRKVSLLMKNISLLPGDTIFHQGVVKGLLVFVASGVLEILSDEDDQSPIIAFKAGTVLGETALLLTTPAKATVRAATNVELQVIERTHFMHMMVNHPDTMAQLRQIIARRLSNAQKQKQFFDKEEVIISFLVSNAKEFRPIKLLKQKLAAVTKNSHQKTTKELSLYCDQDANTSKAVKTDNSLFNEDCLPLYRLSENITLIEAPRICISSKFPWILEANSSLIKFVYMVQLILQFFLCIIYPYYIAFERKIPSAVFIYRVVADYALLCHLALLCCTAVELKDRVLKKFGSIMDYRMRQITFYADMLSVFPIEYMIYFHARAETEDGHFFALLQLNRMLRIWRLHDFFENLVNGFWINVMVIQVIQYSTYLVLIVFWGACILYMDSCYYSICSEGGWFDANMLRSVTLRNSVSCYQHPFQMSLYFATTAILLVGFGDISAKTNLDLLILSMFALIGMVVICYCTARLCATLTLGELVEKEYQEKAFALARFLKDNHMPQSLYERVMTFFRLQWYYEQGTEREDLFASMPPHLSSEVQSTELMKTLRKSNLFKYADVDFIQVVALGAKMRILPPDEIISYSGDMSREMYILQQGHCQIISDNGIILHNHGPGSQLGDIEMIYGIPKRYTVRTETNCKIIVIDYRTYNQAMSMFSSIYYETKEIVEDPYFTNWVNLVDKERRPTSSSRKNIKHRIAIKRTFLMCLNCFKGLLRNSFIRTYHNCHRAQGHDDYWKPFRSLGKFRFLGYLMMPITITPRGPFLRLWLTLRIICIMIICTMKPYYFAVTPYAHKLYWLMLVTDINAAIDIYVQLHVAYYDEKGVLISHPKYTAKYYLAHSFAIDLLANFPFMFFVLWIDSTHDEGHDPIAHIISPHYHHCVWRLNTILQFHRIPETFNYFERDILKNNYILRVFKMLPFTLVIINLVTTITFGSICNYKFYTYQRNDSASEISVWDSATNVRHYGYLECLNGGWFNNSQFREITDPLQIYMINIYWIASTITGVGFGDIQAYSSTTMMLIVFVSIIGVLLFAYVYASLASGHSQFSTTMSNYQEMIRNASRFFKAEHLDPDHQKKIINYYEYIWTRTAGVRSQELCQRLNTALIEDVVLFLYENTLREVPLFEKVDRSFIRVIAKHLSEQYFLKGDTVVRCYDVHSNIYIIYRGKVEVLNSYNEMLACMGPGGLFGNIGQVSAGCSSVTVTASRNLDVLVISSETFYTMLSDYPRIKRNMETLLLYVRDYIMPTTIIEDEEVIHQAEYDLEESDKKGDTESNRKVSLSSNRFSISTVGTISISGRDKDPMTPCQTILNILLPFKWFRFVLDPNNIVLKIVKIASMCVVIYDCTIIPYSFVTQDISLTIWSLLLESVFYIKIFMGLHTTYLDQFGRKETSCKKLIRHYFENKWQIFWDVISNAPLEALCYIKPYKERTILLTSLRLIHLLRIAYLIQYFKEANKSVKVNRILVHVIQICFWIFLTTNIFSCSWFMIGCPFNQCLNDSWATHFNFTATSPASRFIEAACYVIGVSTATGIGEIIPINFREAMLTAFIMLTFRFLIAIAIGDIVTVINDITKSLVQYEYRISCVHDVLQNQNLSNHQMDKLWDYLRQLWAEEKGNPMPQLLIHSPYVLKCDIMEAMFGQHLTNSFLFHGLHEALLRQLAVRLQRIVFFPGNYIIQDGNTDQNMYFIHKGEVSVLTVHPNLTETQHEVLQTQDMFGLAQGLNHGLPHRFSYRAKTKTEILALNLDSWYNILKFFPREKEIIYARAETIYFKV